MWTKSEVTNANKSDSEGWTVTVKRADGQSRILKVKHLVFATGLGAGEGKFPEYPGMVGGDELNGVLLALMSSPQDNFKGQTLHSLQHKRATDHAGKKVVIIGSGTSGK